MKNKYKILDSGNFYFPFIDKGKEFIVEDTIEVTLDKKDIRLIELCLKNSKEDLHFGMLAQGIWNALKEFNWKHKDYWFVPLVLYKLGKDYICSIDILKKVNKK